MHIVYSSIACMAYNVYSVHNVYRVMYNEYVYVYFVSQSSLKQSSRDLFQEVRPGDKNETNRTKAIIPPSFTPITPPCYWIKPSMDQLAFRVGALRVDILRSEASATYGIRFSAL